MKERPSAQHGPSRAGLNDKCSETKRGVKQWEWKEWEEAI